MSLLVLAALTPLFLLPGLLVLTLIVAGGLAQGPRPVAVVAPGARRVGTR